jgi:hypothetical protein
MNKQRHRRLSQGGTSPETTPQTGSGVAHFSVSEVVQFSMSVDNLIETAKAHIRAKVEHPFRVIKQQFGFQKTRLRGMAKNRCKVHVIAALTNLYLARRVLLDPI